MSEYRYYEFVALDRPLTPAEMAELRSISTRAQITPTRFFNEYHWGDLKADPAEQLVGGPVVAFTRGQPELLEQARLSLLAGIDRARSAPPTPTEHWAVAAGYAGIEHAQLVVLNAREDAERRRAQELLEEVRRLRVDRAVFADVLGWRGSRVPITAVVADLADPRDAGTRKALARVRRSVRDVPGATAEANPRNPSRPS